MAITKEIIEDKIEVVGDYKHIQIRAAVVIKEDGVELTRSFSRKVLDCLDSSYDGSTWTHSDTNISGESSEVQGIANVVWTAEIKALQATKNESIPV